MPGKFWPVNEMWEQLKAWLSRELLHSHQIYTDQKQQLHFDAVENCSTENCLKQVVVSDLEGTLLISSSCFAYFMLLAFEASGPLRAFFLLLISPLAWLSHHLISESFSLHILIFVTFVGMKASAVEGVSKAVLPKFFLEDMHPQTLKVVSACGRRCVVTSMPRIMVDSFLTDYLSVDHVLGSEVEVTRAGRCTGFVKSPGLLVGLQKLEAVRGLFAEKKAPDICIGNGSLSDHPFLHFCKKAYIVRRNTKNLSPVAREEYPKPLIFHDGRIAVRPTPAIAMALLLWMPIGIILSISRVALGVLVPLGWSYPFEALLGIKVRVKGSPPQSPHMKKSAGILFVCSHRTVLDPIFVAVALRRHVTAVTYSISRVTEALSPIRTVRLTRHRLQDAMQMKSLLEEGDLVICPEGTTCREPYLLRFSSLFAELADHIVPVTVDIRHSIFHGTTARGWKAMDALYFFMNPSPTYYIEFMEELPMELTCAGGKSSYDVANYIQKLLARSLSFQCTNFTRKDKYRILAGNDGSDAADRKQQLHEDDDEMIGSNKVVKIVNYNSFTPWMRT